MCKKAMGQRIEVSKHVANVSKNDIIAEKDAVYGLLFSLHCLKESRLKNIDVTRIITLYNQLRDFPFISLTQRRREHR